MSSHQAQEQLLSCLEDVKEFLEAMGQVSSAVMVGQAIEEIEALAKETITWTPVAEALPDDDMTVLVACEDGETWFGWRDAGRWLDGGNMLELSDVTHWANLPEGPA